MTQLTVLYPEPVEPTTKEIITIVDTEDFGSVTCANCGALLKNFPTHCPDCKRKIVGTIIYPSVTV